MEDNPLFAQQIRNTMEQMRERKMLPGQVVEPMLHTWAAQVAWERLKYEALRRVAWEYIIESNDVGGIDADDLIDRLERIGAPCPADLDQEN